MKSPCHIEVLALFGCLAGAAGCAVIGEEIVDTQVRVLHQRDRIEPTMGLFAQASQSESTVAIRLAGECRRVRVVDEETTKYVENVNTTIERDVVWLAFGALAGAGGAVLIADSRSVGESADDVRVHNPVGSDAALGMGIGAVAVGAALLAIPTIDVVRSTGGREDRAVDERDDVLAVSEPCEAEAAFGDAAVLALAPKSDVPVWLTRPGSEEPWATIGTVSSAPGSASFDLLEVLSSAPDDPYGEGAAGGDPSRGSAPLAARDDRPTQAWVVLGGQRIGEVGLSAVYARVEAREWERIATARAACAAPATLDACAHVERYATLFAQSRFTPEATALSERGKVLTARLADDQEWAASAVDDCRAAQTEDACGRVEAYVAARPDGGHAAEAQLALSAAAPKLATLRKKREAAERRAETKRAAAEARERAAERRAETKRAAAEAREKAQAASRRRCLARCTEKAMACQDRNVNRIGGPVVLYCEETTLRPCQAACPSP